MSIMEKPNTNKNILLAIEWIEKQLKNETRSIVIDKGVLINDLNFSLKINLELLKNSEGANQRSAYIRTKKIKDKLTHEKT